MYLFIYLFIFVLSSSAAASLLLFPVMPVAFRLPTNQTLAPTVQAMKNKFLLDGKKQNIASKYIFSIPETKSYQSEMLCHFLFIIFIFSIAPLYSHGLQSTVFIHYLTVQDSFSRAITTGLLQCISQCSLRFHVGTLYITAPLQLIVFAPSYCVESGFLMWSFWKTSFFFFGFPFFLAIPWLLVLIHAMMNCFLCGC